MGRYFTVWFRTKNVLGFNRIDWLDVCADDPKDAVLKARRLHLDAGCDPKFELVKVVADVEV